MSYAVEQFFAKKDKGHIPQRVGHHKDTGHITWENGERVLWEDAPSADEIDERLGWSAPAGDGETEMRKAADLLGVIAAWFAASGTIHSAGLRAFALAALLKPDMLPGASVTGLAKTLGCTKQGISKYIRELRRMSGDVFVSPQCRDARSSRARQLATIAQHRRRGHQIHALKQKNGMDVLIAQIRAGK
ncbi:MAG: hypothetical protein WCL11_05500 [Verrucomicrobiota bacterium]